VEDVQLAQIPADQLPDSLRPLLADWNVLALGESGWDDDTRRLIKAIAAATGLPLNPELEEWMALMTGAAGRQGEEQALEGLLHRAAGADPAEASFEQELAASRPHCGQPGGGNESR
jgi:hypothetical protein